MRKKNIWVVLWLLLFFVCFEIFLSKDFVELDKDFEIIF